MTKLNVVVAAALFATSTPALSAKIVSDPAPPNSGPVLCLYQIGTGPVVELPTAIYGSQTGPGCVIDLDPFAAGSYSMQIWYKYTLYNVESSKVPFVLSKPAAGGTGPQNLRVVP
jgi:hypothetical protein